MLHMLKTDRTIGKEPSRFRLKDGKSSKKTIASSYTSRPKIHLPLVHSLQIRPYNRDVTSLPDHLYQIHVQVPCFLRGLTHEYCRNRFNIATLFLQGKMVCECYHCVTDYIKLENVYEHTRVGKDFVVCDDVLMELSNTGFENLIAFCKTDHRLHRPLLWCLANSYDSEKKVFKLGYKGEVELYFGLSDILCTIGCWMGRKEDICANPYNQ
ncbi:PREDICTED: uncharacterized protein LOC109189628 [Ipomoea nil]|uniref:uncharacterized protein LOC109189628 n=1 Tax=Ipomoea nil TaxID=35883 RepID=UPI0009018C1E|nr:PREDICTED: uncharacterized protein LOC109189628 [Ipomoea nil]